MQEHERKRVGGSILELIENKGANLQRWAASRGTIPGILYE
jgi:hypothetical protein